MPLNANARVIRSKPSSIFSDLARFIFRLHLPELVSVRVQRSVFRSMETNVLNGGRAAISTARTPTSIEQKIETEYEC